MTEQSQLDKCMEEVDKIIRMTPKSIRHNELKSILEKYIPQQPQSLPKQNESVENVKYNICWVNIWIQRICDDCRNWE